ncbi:MAG: helix-turn-helix transcriptional regulator [Thermoanaerobaculia bacterium]
MSFKALGALIRLHRRKRGYTQQRLAQLAGVSRQQLSLLEGGASVSLTFLVKVTWVLEITELPFDDPDAEPDLLRTVRVAMLVARVAHLLQSASALVADVERTQTELDALIDESLAARVQPEEAG